MPLNDLAILLEKHWTELTRSPLLFGALALASATIGYLVAAGRKKRAIAILKRRVGDYESKLEVGSPDEAKTKFDRLEGEITGMNKVIAATIGKEWKPLSDAEIINLAAKLTPMPKHRVQLMYLNQLGRPLAATLHEAFVKAGWAEVVFSPGSGAHAGIIVGPGRGRAGALRIAIQERTHLRVELDKPNGPELDNLVYLFVGINDRQQ